MTARRPLHGPEVAAHHRAVSRMLVLGVLGAHQVGGHHRGDEARDKQREQDGNGDRQAKLSEVLPRDPGHEADGDKDRDDGEGGGDDGKADLVRRLDRGAVGGLAHADVPGDVLDFHDGVIDKDAGGQRDGEEGHQVQREAQHVHDPERWHGGQRQGNGGDQRGAPVAQEGEHHQHGQQGAFQQRVDRGLVVAIGVENGVINQRDADIGILGADRVERGVHHLGHRNLGCALGAEHGKGHHLIAVEAREGPQLLIGVDDLAKLGQPDVLARRQGDGRRGKVLDRARIAKRADRLFARAQFRTARAEVGVRRRQLRADRLRGDAETVEFHRVELDADLALGPAIAIHAAYARLALQRTGDRVVHEPRDLFDGQVRGRDGEGHDRLPLDVDAGDDGRFDVAGQVAADLVDGVLDVLHRLVGGHFHAEFDGGGRDAVGHGGGDVLDPRDARHGILDFLRHLRFKFGWCRARLGHADRDEGHVDVREAGDRQGVEALPAEDHQQDEGQQRRDGVADRPGGKVHRSLPVSSSQRGPG